MAMIPAGKIKPMPDDDKWKEAKRILSLIKYELPKIRDFAIYIERNNLKLSKEDSFILNQVQDEVSKLLIRSGLYEYSPSDNTVWLRRIPVDEDSETKHEILKFLYATHLQFFRKDLSYELSIDVYKLDYLTENMKNDGAINKIDASSKEGKDYIIEISDKGNGMYLNDYYLNPNNKKGYSISVNNDYSKKIKVKTNNGVVNQDSDFSNSDMTQSVTSTPKMKHREHKIVPWYSKVLFKYFIWPVLAALTVTLIIYLANHLHFS